MTFLYEGFLALGTNGEEDDILYLKGRDNFLVEDLEEEIGGKVISLKYYICNKKISLEEAQEYFVKQLYGELNVNYQVRYSEITGYLWTDEDLEVGGHDLLTELKTYVGSYLILVIDIHNQETNQTSTPPASQAKLGA